jgi:hypothetical protein
MPGAAKPAADRFAQLGHLVPGDARRRQDDALGQPVATLDLRVAVADVQQLDHDLVRRPGIVRIDDADAIGHHETALEWRAASGENPEEVSGRHLDDETGAHQGNVPWRHHHVVGRGQIEAG